MKKSKKSNAYVVFLMVAMTILSACSESMYEVEGEFTTTPSDTVVVSKNLIDVEKISCQLKNLGQISDSTAGNALVLSVPAEMHAKFNFVYQVGNNESNEEKIVAFKSNNSATISGLKNISLSTDTVQQLMEKTYKFDRKAGGFVVGGQTISVSFSNDTETLSFVENRRTFSYKDGTLCGIEIVDASLQFTNIYLVSGSKTTYHATKIIKLFFSDKSVREYVFDDGTITTSEKDEVNYFVENIVEKGSNVSFDIVERHTIDTDKDLKIPMSFNRNTTIETGEKIVRSEKNNFLTYSSEEKGEWKRISDFSNGSITGEVATMATSYSFSTESGKISTSVIIKTVRNVKVSYKNKIIEVPLSDPSCKMLELKAVSSTEVGNIETTTYNTNFCVVTNGQNGPQAVQIFEIMVEKPIHITGYELVNEWITLKSNKFFQNLNVRVNYSNNDTKEFTSQHDMNSSISDNGTITVIGKVNSITTDGNISRNIVSTFASDTTSGNKLSFTQKFNVANQTAVVTLSISEINKYRHHNFTNKVATISFKELVTTNKKTDGNYNITEYDIVYTVSYDGLTVEHRQKLVEKIINHQPTFPGYKLVKAEVSDVYYQNRPSKFTALVAVFESIANPSQNKIVSYNLDVFGQTLASNGNNMSDAMSKSQVGNVIENLNYDNTYVLSMVYNNSVAGGFELAYLATVKFEKPSNTSYKDGFNYKGISSGFVHGFYTNTVTIETYVNPYKAYLSPNAEGYAEYQGLYLVSDK